MAPVTITAAALDSVVVMRRLMIPATLFFAATLLGATGCSKESGGDLQVPGTTAPASGEGPVTIKGIAFNPKEVHVKVGQELLWNWDDGGLEHTVTADDTSFDSGRKASGSFARTFTAAGTVAYHCEVHSRMHGTIVVAG
jgi:plastocyanin